MVFWVFLGWREVVVNTVYSVIDGLENNKNENKRNAYSTRKPRECHTAHNIMIGKFIIIVVVVVVMLLRTKCSVR